MADLEETGMGFYQQQEFPGSSNASARLTVTGLTRVIKKIIEESLPVVSVEGEISNYVKHTSGHRYFTLKDETSQIRCVMFKWQAQGLGFEPEEGMKVVAAGEVTVYEKAGHYQLNVLRLETLGRGDLLARLEDLKRKLAAEGVFANQRTLPPFPRTVGVITSSTGAAVRDIISIINRRAPHVQIVLRPTQVQGENAPLDIVNAIEEMNLHSQAELLIVGRGGGSIEDLWCFNDAAVARAIAGSRLPVISAVGHETDFTLADFAADLRAPTPSAAAELSVRKTAELLEFILTCRTSLARRMSEHIQKLETRLYTANKSLAPERFSGQFMMRSMAVDELVLRLKGSCREMMDGNLQKLEGLKGKLLALDPKGVLARGYSVVWRERDRALVNDSSMVMEGDSIEIEAAKGRYRARVEN